MAPKDEDAHPGVTLSSKQNIHLRVSIIISRNHAGDDGAPKENKYKLLTDQVIPRFRKHLVKKLNLNACDLSYTVVRMLRMAYLLW